MCESTSLSAQIFAPFQEQESLARTIWHLRTVRSLVSCLFFRYRALSFQKEKREDLVRDSLVKITTVLLPGFGRAESAISVNVATPPPPPAPSAVGLAPSARQKASK